MRFHAPWLRRSLAIALQCLNQNSSATAWTMLEAELTDASGAILQVKSTGLARNSQ